MRVLMLSSSYPKYVGETTAPFIEEIAAGMVARGHHVDLLAPWHPELRRAPEERGVHLRFFRYAPHPALNIWGYAQSLHSDVAVKRRTLAAMPFALTGTLAASFAATLRTQYDLIHAHWVLPNGVPAALVANAVQLPLVISLHGSDIYLAERHWALTGASGAAFRSAAAISACSSDLHERALRLGAPLEHTYTIPYGVNPDQFRPDQAAYTAVRQELGLAADTRLVVGVGRLVAKKGFAVLLEAWPTVLERCPQARLAIVGYGDLREKLEQQAHNLGIGGRVHFTGQLERARTAAYIAAADVFALPIVPEGTDGLPNVLLEAMGAARAVVASHTAGVPDVIDDGVHGLIVPQRDAQALANAIGRLLDEPAFAQNLGDAARARIERELTWQRTAERFEELYAVAVERRA
jgi:glycosyltransferase involved in cell wall biosynthesis